jgi:hypothetical protein
MNRVDADRLWAHVQSLLRHPGLPDDAERRRAARMLASSRADAVELLLAQWLAQGAPGEVARPAQAAEHAVAVPEVPAPAAPQADGTTVPARAAPRFGLREAALVTAGVAGGALLGGLLGEDASDGFDLDLG